MQKKPFQRMSQTGYHSYKGARPGVKRKSKVENPIIQALPKEYKKSVPILIVIAK